ncbi:MAG TPA: DNA polymerase I [bacterium]|nr:DNA polymerase I [bacterium]HQG44299.1 DNA polymerase I [bacterium]HQI47747.1 DNA polymerase I [bacterium]HQJ63870.1 DNA polymerase I [bacterium]
MPNSAGRKRLFLIDGAALAYRTYFAFARTPLVNSRGEHVSVIFGFARVLLNLLEQEKPDLVAVVFDSPEPTFRHEMYAEYKAQRQHMPEDMADQLPRLEELLEALDIPLIRKPGFEADDIMGTLARRAATQGLETVLVTGDKDLMQLVDDHTLVYYPHRAGEKIEWLDSAAVTEKMGVPPSQIIDYLALCGDASDNIPGVPGIGPVGALALLKQYGSLGALLNQAEQIEAKKHRVLLQEHADLARLSQTLATIHCDVPLDITVESLAARPVPAEKAAAFFRKMDLPSLADKFSSRAAADHHYHLVMDRAGMEALAERLQQSGAFAFDTETTSIDPMRADLVGLSFSCAEGEAWYVPVKGPEDLAAAHRPLALQEVLAILRPVLTNPDLRKSGHNAKYDLIVLARNGIEVAGLACDTMVADYLINPSGFQHNLDSASLEHLGLKKIPTTQLLGTGKNQRTMDQVPIEQVAEYACEDADYTWRLEQVMMPKIEALGLRPLFDDVEVPLIHVLVVMERNGVALDEQHLAAMSKELEQELGVIENSIYELAGHAFNINSPKQLGEILFNELKLPSARKTKTGFSTDVGVLEELAGKHPLPQRILDYRQLAKLKSTYVDALPRLINPATGRVHTSYNQTVAATGRLSSTEPNLQNIPIRTEVGRRIRRAFIPGDREHLILDADYSQIELRIMAHLSGDKTLRDSFLADEDVHARTASLVFKVAQDEVTPEQRRRAKEVNFGIMYGMGAYGLAQRLGLANDEAEQFILAYFASYPGVQEYMLRTVREARQNGYVTTLLGRRRMVPDIASDNRRIREFAERTAINTPIQGSAADLIKVAMIRIQNRLEQEKCAARMIMQVHDELVFEVPRDEIEAVRALVRAEMEGAIKLEVPVKVETGVGNNWLEAH